jgi:hypothetical protein
MLQEKHDFQESLKASHEASDMPFWEDCYRKAFRGFSQRIDCRANGPHQQLGIDAQIRLDNPLKPLINIDEKCRFRNKKTGKVYADVLLEHLSDATRKAPGWVCKPLMADYIAYAIAPLGTCYLLPVEQLQQAWARYGERWKATYRTVPAENRDRITGREWTTLSVPVPVAILFPAIGECLRVSFSPFEQEPCCCPF